MPGTLFSRAAAAGLVALLVPCSALAQAWLPPRGEGYVTFGYQNIYAPEHITNSGQPVDLGHMWWQNAVFDLNYSATDRLQFRVGIPYVVSRYSGAFPHDPPNGRNLDTGAWNGNFQDFRLEVRYGAKTTGLVITPFAALGLPSHDYQYFAHAAPGMDLKQVTAGVTMGRLLDPLLSKGYTQARVAFSVPQKVLGISHNRMNLDAQLGYFATPWLNVYALGAWQWTRGGWTTDDFPPLTSSLIVYHDQLVRESYFDLGFGASVSATRYVELTVAAFRTMYGRNTIQLERLLGGDTFGFSSARLFKHARERQSSSAPARPPRAGRRRDARLLEASADARQGLRLRISSCPEPAPLAPPSSASCWPAPRRLASGRMDPPPGTSSRTSSPYARRRVLLPGPGSGAAQSRGLRVLLGDLSLLQPFRGQREGDERPLPRARGSLRRRQQ